ncbi:helix-turn-helix domain-containing protein [Acinetobacter indicus]|uniref:helix-turn-helix domain-containing protein n=1 Tax=Acinetobacter indicus TaxID=756892 RepID=UPI002578A7F4|nr:helix-turn-helix transcriptional regulator [Acinetobacter indicus]MDM1492663.1 helix-turn-helix transcriptional regulator [Acinetobacter indicus]
MSSIHDPRYKRLIQELINIRELKKITQVELAASLKKPQSYVAKVENLDRRLDILELSDWLSVLDISIIAFIEKAFSIDT